MPVSDDTGIFCFTAHCTGCAQKGLTFMLPRRMMDDNLTRANAAGVQHKQADGSRGP